MRRGLAVGLLLVFGAGVGCSARIQPPPGYVAVREPAPYDYKAVSATGNVLAVTRHANEQAGADLAFWSAAIEHQKVTLDGMKLVARDAIKSGEGREGVMFCFEEGDGAAKLTYLVAVFVSQEGVDVVEAAGPAERMAGEMDKLKGAMGTLK